MAVPPPTPLRGCLALALALLCACVCPPRAEDLARAGRRSPEQAFRSFQAYMRADLLEQEYRSFSTSFTARNQLSLATYAEGREQLFRERPWLKRIAAARIVDSQPSGEGVHVLDVEAGGRTFRVRMAREDFFEIRAGERLLADGEASFERLVAVRPLPDPQAGSRIQATVTVDLAPGELGELTEVLMARSWKIDDFRELDRKEGGPHSP